MSSSASPIFKVFGIYFFVMSYVKALNIKNKKLTIEWLCTLGISLK